MKKVPANNHIQLDERIDALVADWRPVKKKMFSGYGYMINGNLAFGTHKKDELIVRAGEEQAEKLLKAVGIKPLDMGRGPMKNWYLAGPEAFDADEKLMGLLKTGYYFAKSLPPKRNT